MTKVRVTKTQYEILEHRLSIPDCIAECLNDDGQRMGVIEEEDVENSAAKLTEMAKAGVIDWAELTALDKDVLHDSLDGSTFIGSAWGEIGNGVVTQQRYQGYQRSFGNIVEKLEAVGLEKVCCGYI